MMLKDYYLAIWPLDIWITQRQNRLSVFMTLYKYSCFFTFCCVYVIMSFLDVFPLIKTLVLVKCDFTKTKIQSSIQFIKNAIVFSKISQSNQGLVYYYNYVYFGLTSATGPTVNTHATEDFFQT